MLTFYVFSPERKFSKSSNFGSADPLFETGCEKKKLHRQLLAAKGLIVLNRKHPYNKGHHNRDPKSLAVTLTWQTSKLYQKYLLDYTTG